MENRARIRRSESFKSKLTQLNGTVFQVADDSGFYKNVDPTQVPRISLQKTKP